jgi:hypothetical protein
MTHIRAFSYKYNLNLIKTEDVQNISLFIIACSSFFSYLYYNLAPLLWENTEVGGLTKQFDIIFPFVGLYAFVDFFITKSYDLKFHHLCILGNIFYNYYCNVSNEHRFIFLYPLLKTEISSIFYVLKYWLPKKTILYNANTLLFYISFAKLRIYDFYYEIIYNNISFDVVFQRYSNTNNYVSSILLISCYGLYILNLYWFLIMNKILYKTITKVININTDILCHKLCYYLHWINIPLSYCIYSRDPHGKHIFDMIGITVLSITSYKYHYDIYNRLYNKQIEDYFVPNKDNIVLFFIDNVAINMRSFFVVATNYYNNQNLFLILIASAILHVLSIYYCILNGLELLIGSNKNKDTFVNWHNILSGLPIVCDVLLISANSPTEISIPFLLVNIMIGLLFIVDPFYKLTHAGFHVLLIFQNYYMCLSNIK